MLKGPDGGGKVAALVEERRMERKRVVRRSGMVIVGEKWRKMSGGLGLMAEEKEDNNLPFKLFPSMVFAVDYD